MTASFVLELVALPVFTPVFLILSPRTWGGQGKTAPLLVLPSAVAGPTCPGLVLHQGLSRSWNSLLLWTDPPILHVLSSCLDQGVSLSPQYVCHWVLAVEGSVTLLPMVAPFSGLCQKQAGLCLVQGQLLVLFP